MTNHDRNVGICLACSYHCHEGHELVELYTKRNFKCDCGTKRYISIVVVVHHITIVAFGHGLLKKFWPFW